MDFGFDSSCFYPGQFVVYANGGDNHVGEVEIGVVKRVCDDGCFVAYNTGDTCAKTPYGVLVAVKNSFVAKALVQRSEQLGAEQWPLSESCEDWGRDA